MREEYGLARERVSGGGLPFSLDDDHHQMNLCASVGLPVEQWAKTRGVPIDYARALHRYLSEG